MNINEINDRIKALFDDSVKNIRRIHDTDDDFYVYDNQIETAKEIIYNFYTKESRWNLLFAEMQSGKSGTFFSIPYIISKNKILIEKLGIDMFDGEINVFLLTGMNEKELISQFEKDIYGFLGKDLTKNVLHNSEMKKILASNEDNWSSGDFHIINKMRKNSLILIDESHYGSNKDQILDKFLRKVLHINPNGDEQNLEKNNIFVVSISATPMAEFVNANLSEYNKKIVPLRNSQGYWGIVNMFNNNKIHESYDLKCNTSIDNFLDKILNNDIGYTLVRCTEKNQKKVMDRIGTRMLSNLSIVKYDQWERSNKLNNQGINDILSKIPTKRTIVFLKGLLRAGKRVDTKNVVMVHDTLKSNTDTTVQSLLGRCCGYNKNKNVEIYCDELSAEMFKDWVESDFNLDKVPNKAKNIVKTSRNKYHIKKVEILKYDLLKELNYLYDKNHRSVDERIEIIKSYIVGSNYFMKDFYAGSFYDFSKKSVKDAYKSKDGYLCIGDMDSEFNNDKSSPIGKYVITPLINRDKNEIEFSIGEIVEVEILSSEKSMYHETNII